MADRSVQIAGLALRFSWDASLSPRPFPAAYEPFLVAARREDCLLRLELGLPPAWTAPRRQECVFSSSEAWAAYRRQDGWDFVCPSPRAGTGKRLLRWAPAEHQARLWVNLPAFPPDPLGDLSLPFFADLYARHGGILVHGAAVEVAGQAWVFAGPSGSGKSHWARLCQERGLPVLDEDRLVLQEVGGQMWAFGTPWHPEPRLSVPTGAPIGRVFFLQLAAPDEVQTERPARAASLLLRSTCFPMYDPVAMAGVLDVAGKTATQAQSFSLGRASGPELPQRLLDL